MEGCIGCGGSKDYSFRVLEVQTFPIRDMGGEKKVQTLGKFRNYTVCTACAKAQLDRCMDVRKTVRPSCIKFGTVFVAGIGLLVFFWQSTLTLRYLGIAAILCGILGIYDTIQKALRHRKEYKQMTHADALYQAAWEVLLDKAEKKWEDSDLSYIPVDEKTLSMKNGDLMLCYHLLPEIAMKAYELIHEDTGTE